MAIYEVTVPFEPLIATSMGSAQWSRPPDSFTVGEITCQYDAARMTCSAKLEIEAGNPTEAKEKAVGEVRRALAAFAVEGHAFRVVYGSELQARVKPTEPPAAAEPDSVDAEGERVLVASAGDYVMLGAEVAFALEKVIGSVDFAHRVVSRFEALPDDRLRRALELNYIAAVTPEEWAAFLVRYVALELIVEYLAGSAIPLVKARLQSPSKRRDLRRRLRKTLSQDSIFTGREIDRLIDILFKVDQRSRHECFVDAFQRVGIAAEDREIRIVTDVRNAIAHQGRTPETKDEGLAFERARKWVQAALTKLLSEDTLSTTQ